MADPDPADAILATLTSSSTVAQVGGACLRALPRISGTAVAILTGVNTRRSVFTSDDVSAAIEDAQFEHGEGPCFEAFRTGVPVFVADLRDPVHVASWPGYVPAALLAGAVAVAALPITAGGRRFAVLDLYRSIAGPFDDNEAATAARFADAAGHALLHAPSAGGADADYAPERRDVVHQAVGMVMVQVGGNRHDALARLRAHAYATETHLADTAADVLGHRLSFTP
ncbi:GAF domain-containing protein [Winogradskya consettensis]|uniref:GAF domain-containing protein n=1 Tax=Winogradskya consettensis TaxID=113560 RepID=A0A919SAJ7_9ACTN|nr:GAF and ANTAR domain-containing protein [Actinoplanes consettensis]GIM68022.1 GAF domain-containing protein [Actinoplanes consettensis]